MHSYKARITVTLRPSILDPQGKAAHRALTNLGFSTVQEVRVGKVVEMVLHEPSLEAARAAAEAACQKLLANPVMEDYAVTVRRVPEIAAAS